MRRIIAGIVLITTLFVVGCVGDEEVQIVTKVSSEDEGVTTVSAVAKTEQGMEETSEISLEESTVGEERGSQPDIVSNGSILSNGSSSLGVNPVESSGSISSDGSILSNGSSSLGVNPVESSGSISSDGSLSESTKLVVGTSAAEVVTKAFGNVMETMRPEAAAKPTQPIVKPVQTQAAVMPTQPTEKPVQTQVAVMPTQAVTQSQTSGGPQFVSPTQAADFDPYYVVAEATQQLKADGYTNIIEDLNTALAEGSISQEDYNIFYPKEESSWFEMSSFYGTNEEEIYNLVESCKYLCVDGYFHIEYMGYMNDGLYYKHIFRVYR